MGTAQRDDTWHSRHLSIKQSTPKPAHTIEWRHASRPWYVYIYHVLMQVDETTAAFGSFSNHSTSPRWSVMPPKTRPGQSSSFGFNVSTVSTSEDLYKEYQPIDGKPEYKRPVQELLGIPGHSHDAALTNTFDLTLKTDCSCTDWKCWGLSSMMISLTETLLDLIKPAFFCFVGATWCHFLLQLAFLCISWHAFHTSLWAFRGTQVVALQLCRRCQELARCNALLNSWNSWALRRRAQWCQGQKWRETFLRITVMWNPLRAFQFQCLWYTDASSFRMVQMQGCISWSTWYLYTAMYSFVQLTRLHVTHGGLGSQSHLGQPSQDLSACAAGIRCPAFHLFDVGTFLATLTFGMHQTGWFGGFVNCATSVCFGYHIGPAECWCEKNMPSEIQLSRKVFPMS